MGGIFHAPTPPHHNPRQAHAAASSRHQPGLCGLSCREPHPRRPVRHDGPHDSLRRLSHARRSWATRPLPHPAALQTRPVSRPWAVPGPQGLDYPTASPPRRPNARAPRRSSPTATCTSRPGWPSSTSPTLDQFRRGREGPNLATVPISPGVTQHSRGHTHHRPSPRSPPSSRQTSLSGHRCRLTRHVPVRDVSMASTRGGGRHRLVLGRSDGRSSTASGAQRRISHVPEPTTHARTEADATRPDATPLAAHHESLAVTRTNAHACRGSPCTASTWPTVSQDAPCTAYPERRNTQLRGNQQKVSLASGLARTLSSCAHDPAGNDRPSRHHAASATARTRLAVLLSPHRKSQYADRCSLYHQH